MLATRFLTSGWRHLNSEYFDEIIGGARRPRHIGATTDTQRDIRRAALTATGTGSEAGPSGSILSR